MANSLINGTEGGMASPQVEPDPNAGKVPTWGYGVDGAKLFHLDPGTGLPAGYEDHPDKVGAAPAAPAKKAKLTLKAADDDSV